MRNAHSLEIARPRRGPGEIARALPIPPSPREPDQSIRSCPVRAEQADEPRGIGHSTRQLDDARPVPLRLIAPPGAREGLVRQRVEPARQPAIVDRADVHREVRDRTNRAAGRRAQRREELGLAGLEIELEGPVPVSGRPGASEAVLREQLAENRSRVVVPREHLHAYPQHAGLLPHHGCQCIDGGGPQGAWHRLSKSLDAEHAKARQRPAWRAVHAEGRRPTVVRLAEGHEYRRYAAARPCPAAAMGQRQPDTGARKSLLTAFTVRRLLSQHPDTGGPRSYGTRSDHAQPPSAARGAAAK